MADPLSVTASIITVVGAANAVAKGLRRLKAAKDAPEGLQDLILDVAQIEMVLNGVKSAVLSSGSPSIELATLTEDAGSKLLELRSLIEYTLKKAGGSDKVDRWQWLRKGNEVERLRNQLGTIRLNLVALTSSANFGVLQRVSLVTQDLSSEQRRLNAQITSVLPRHEALLNHLCQRVEESEATKAAMMRLLGNFRQVDANVTSDSAAALSETLKSPAATPIAARPRMRSRREFHVQNLQIQSACPVTCTCNCHQTWEIDSPRVLRRLFGHSKIEGAGLPFFKSACSRRSCKGKRATFVNINFFLPTTIAARMIDLWFTSSPLYGPELLLRVPRVVRTDSPVYEAILFGDLDAVKRCISAGDYKPWDVDYHGESLINNALQAGNYTVALYLAQVASDNFECLREDYPLGLEPSTVGCLLYWADWNFPKLTVLATLILNLKPFRRKGRSPFELDSVPGVDWNELFDMNGFSELHKIVCGVSSRSLDAEIDARPEDLDRPDNFGLTALWWACWFDNSNHTRILLQHGADVNNASTSPLRAAVWSGSYHSLEQLLDAGVSFPDSAIDSLSTIYAVGREENLKEVLATDKALFGRFLGVNRRSSRWPRATALMNLATWGPQPTSYARMRQLLELGADTELADEGGLTALCCAIYSGNAEGCKILGRAGANANVKTNKGNTILHLAIRTARDADTIQAVSELDLWGVELGAKDNFGRTAFELLEIRAGRHRNHQHLFPGLCCYDLDSYGSVNRDHYVKNIDTEVQILSSFQALLQQVQEVQGIPVEDRYPLLDLTHESIMIHRNEDGSLKSLPSVPGAWPEN